MPHGGPRKRQTDTLTTREIEVLRLYGQGKKRKQIAQELFRSPKTIDARWNQIYRKTGLKKDPATIREFLRTKGL